MKKYLILTLLLLPFIMGTAPTRQYDFTSGTTIRSNEVDTELDNLFGHLSKGITNSTSYWLCEDVSCVSTCQVVIDGGIITACN